MSVDNIQQTPLTHASNNKYNEIVKILLKHPNIDVNVQDIYGNTALINAAGLKQIDNVKALLAHPNIDVNIQDDNGNTCLIEAAKYAAKYENTKIVKMLLEHGNIDINFRDNHGKTAMDYMPEIVQWKKEIAERKAKEAKK